MPQPFPSTANVTLVSWAGVTYRNIHRLGSGGSASTYLMLATSGPYKGMSFAVKVFTAIKKSAWTESFMQEMSFLRNCQHPGIMRIFDDGVYSEEYPFFVAEYLPLTLHTVRTQTSHNEKIAYAAHLLSALNYLSRLDPPALHRDIKPKNIFVKGSSCVLGDFALVRRFREADLAMDQAALRQSLRGMPQRYRTPDLVEYLKTGLYPTPKSDVYQLGLVLAEFFTGENPQKPMTAGGFASSIECESVRDIPGETKGEQRCQEPFCCGRPFGRLVDFQADG